MADGTERPQRFCTNCEAAIRPGTDFCVTCGVDLTSWTSGLSPDGDEAGKVGTWASSVSADGRGRYGRGFERFRALSLPQKIVLAMLVASTAYVLIAYTSLFVTLVFGLAIVSWLLRVGLREERRERIVQTAYRHATLSGIGLLMLVCSTPLLVPAVGAFLLNLLTVAAGILTVAVSSLIPFAAVAAVIGVLWLVIMGMANAAEKGREREEAHRRWYNSLSESEKQTYQMEQQTKLTEARQRIEEAERLDRALRRMNRRFRR